MKSVRDCDMVDLRVFCVDVATSSGTGFGKLTRVPSGVNLPPLEVIMSAIPADAPIASDVSCKTCVWSRSVIHFALLQVFLPSQRVNRLMEKNMGSGSGRTYPSARASRPGLAREVHRKAG